MMKGVLICSNASTIPFQEGRGGTVAFLPFEKGRRQKLKLDGEK
jgi:hypothetical protein